MRRLVFLLPLLVLSAGCDGAFVADDAVSVQILSDGLAVTNERDETIYIAAYGEWALIHVDPAPQTAEQPGYPIAAGERDVLPFDPSGALRADDDRFTVSWVTVVDGELGATGYLSLER